MVSAHAWPRKPAALSSSGVAPRAARSSPRNSAPPGTRATIAKDQRRANPAAQGFGRSRRLPDQASFNRVFAGARRSRDRAFTVLCRPNEGTLPRLGLAISKRNCRLAVARNRLKRIIRESFRTHQAALGGLDIVVMNNKGADGLSNRQLFASLAQHWQRCTAAGRGNQTGPNG